MSFNNSKFKVLSKKFFYSGFSLIEVLVALGVIAMVTAVAMPNLRDFNRGQQVEGAGLRLMNDLRRAQSSASARIQCPNGTSSTNWNIVMTPTAYTLNCFTSANIQVFSGPYSADSNSTTTLTMTNDGCAAGQTLTFFFTPFQTTYTCASTQGSNWPVRITLTKSGVGSEIIVVEAGGVIRNE